MADNGPPFQSGAYKQFCPKCDILCCVIATYSLESNGFAEKSVDIAKKAMKKLVVDLESKSNKVTEFQLKVCINRFLFNFCNTPSTLTGKAPKELMSFHPRTELTMLHTNTLASYGNLHFTLFREGDKVTIKIGKTPAIEGIVVRQCGVGSPNYLVSIAGVFKKVHANQLSHAPFST